MKAIILLLSTTLVLVGPVLSQDNNLAIDATVKDSDGGRLTGAVVNLYQDGNLINKVTTGRNGRFDLILDFGHEYLVEVAKSGFVAKRLYFNTHNVPEDEQAWGYEFGGFIVDLFKDVPGIDFSVLDEPVGKVYYDARIQNFEYDRQYTKLIKEELDELEDDYEEKLRQQEQLEKQLEEDYRLAMRDGQLALDAKDFITAKENFMAASSMKPDEAAPKQKISEVDRAIELESGTEEKYLAALAEADEFFGSEKFAEAKAKYNEALKVKPNESYPRGQLGKCDEGIARLAKEREEKARQQAEEEKYQKAITLADQEFQSQSYEAAKRYYNEAAGMRPDEPYPKGQLSKIEGLIAKAEQDAEAKKQAEELQRQYTELIGQGDTKMTSEQYAQAIEFYEEAIELKPEEAYPKEQIDKANAAIAKLDADSKQKKLDEEYERMIATADNAFNRKDWDNAKDSYNEAASLKPDEQYPKDQLQKIGEEEAKEAEAAKLATAKAEQDAKYKELISKADIAFEAGGYDQAKEHYTASLEIKPNETYPNDQLKAIDNKLAELENQKAALKERERLQKEYDDLIESADASFGKKNYKEASVSYSQALKLKPNEVYPKTQLDIIDLRLKELAEQDLELKEQEELNAKYEAAIQAADRELADDNLDNAENNYREAASLKPDEVYPSQQLELIEEKRKEVLAQAELVEEENKRREEYDAIIARADKSYEGGQLRHAKGEYEEALEIYSDKSYPKDRITLIDRELEKQEADVIERARLNKLTAEYESLIDQADALLKSNDLEAAKETYQKSLEIKSEEVYPKNQIAKIDQLLKDAADRKAREEELKRNYDEWVSKGDQAIVDQDWDAARDAFREALKIFPTEPIPQERLTEVDNLEARQTETERKEAFDKLVGDADKLFLQQKFEEARDLYNESLEYYPNADHPRERIVRIDKILEELEEQDFSQEELELEKKIIEETYTEGNRTITIRKVIIGEKEEIYKKVVHPWGGKYYFLNDRPISELVWTRETTPK